MKAINYKQGLPKIARDDTKIFVLGSFPSEVSLQKQQYYANKRNQFWKVIGYCIDEELQDLDYQTKIETLLDNKIGLWDTIKSCQRQTSSDSKIKNETYNDLDSLKNQFKDLELLVFNGKFMTTTKQRRDFLDNLEIEYFFAPSTSTAYPLKLKQKQEEWSNILKI